jgi:hypothetical protein
VSDAELYVSAVTVERVEGVHRRATLPTGEHIEMGVHGAIAAHYKLNPVPPLPLPVDYVVAATAG